MAKNKQRQQPKPPRDVPLPPPPQVSLQPPSPQHTQMDMDGGPTSALPTVGHFAQHTSPRSAVEMVSEDENDDEAWQEDGTYSDTGDNEETWGNNAHEAGQTWGTVRTSGQNSRAGGGSPIPGAWDQPAPETQGAWSGLGGLASAITSAFQSGQNSTQADHVAAAAQGVSRKSTLKKTPPATHKVSPAATPASRHVAFGNESSQSSTLLVPPPPLPPGQRGVSSASGSLPTPAPPMHGRSHSQGAVHGDWSAPTRTQKAAQWGQPMAGTSQPHARARASTMPPAQQSAPANASSARTFGGAWTNWTSEAQANEARKQGLTQFATAFQANVPMNTRPAPPPPPQATLAGGNLYHDRNRLASQLHSVLSHPQQPSQGPPMHSRNPVDPAYPSSDTLQQPLQDGWQNWSQQPKLPQTMRGQPQSQRPQQVQPSNSWGSREWTDTGGPPWPSGAVGGFSGDTKPQDQNWNDQGADVWANAGDEAGDYGPWGTFSDDRNDKRGGKHSRGKSTGNVGWGQAATSEMDQHVDDEWGMHRRKAPTTTGHGGFDGPIYEEEEGEEEEDYDDDFDDMYTDPEDHNDRVNRKSATHSGISYQYQSPSGRQTPGTPSGFGYGKPKMNMFPAEENIPDPPSKSPHLPDPKSSKTLNWAAGRMTTVFELMPPRQGLGENTFVWSQGAALQHARRAFYSGSRRAKERIHWAFNPHKDPRVGSLITWIEAMSNGLATIGLQKFLETGQRGALITNADYRSNAFPGAPTQPAFDWISLPEVQPTHDRVLQESIVTYKPDAQVVVFVFLLSKTGNSMAMWRRKIAIPEGVRAAHRDAIYEVMATLPRDKVVYVDEAPPPEPPPPEPPKKKKRGFWRRLFGLK